MLTKLKNSHCGRRGGWQSRSSPLRRLRQIGTEIGWHTFRHTYSSMLRQLGVDVKVQQELLRHADAGTTLNLYTEANSDQSAQRIPVWCASCFLQQKSAKAKQLDISGQEREVNSLALSMFNGRGDRI